MNLLKLQLSHVRASANGQSRIGNGVLSVVPHRAGRRTRLDAPVIRSSCTWECSGGSWYSGSGAGGGGYVARECSARRTKRIPGRDTVVQHRQLCDAIVPVDCGGPGGVAVSPTAGCTRTPNLRGAEKGYVMGCVTFCRQRSAIDGSGFLAAFMSTVGTS